MAELVCTKSGCKEKWLVHSAHLWRYRSSVIANRRCPECGSKGTESKSAIKQFKSRNKEVEEMTSGKTSRRLG